MKVFVETIELSNPEVMQNIVHALESAPIDGGSYEVACVEHDTGDVGRGYHKFRLDVYRNEMV